MRILFTCLFMVSVGTGAGASGNQKDLTWSPGDIEFIRDPLDLPGTGNLIRSFEQLDVSEDIKGKFAEVLMQESGFQYWRLVNLNKSEKIARVIRGRTQKLKTDEDRVFGFTKGRDLFLLPDYFTLTNTCAQSAILFQLTLQQLKAKSFAESAHLREAYRKWCDHGFVYSSTLYQLLAKFFYDPSLDLRAAASSDFRSGRLKGFLALAPYEPMFPTFSMLKSTAVVNPVRTQRMGHLSDGVTREQVLALPLEIIYPYAAYALQNRSLLKGYYTTMISRYPEVRLFRALLRWSDRLFVFVAREAEHSWKMTWVMPWETIPYEGHTSGPRLRPFQILRGLDANNIELSLVLEKDTPKSQGWVGYN